jgi:CheY-like chemotaxis protein
MNRKKILVVDDSPVIVRTLSMKLASAGYQAISAFDGSEAVSSVRKEKPDLIILDISFPPDVAHGGGIAWDGFRIIDWLRRIDEAKDTPIIVITGGSEAEYKDRAFAAGAIAFFKKPIDTNELLDVIQRTLTPDANPSAA